MNLKRSLENLFRGQAVLLTTRSQDDPSMAVPVTADNPLPVVMAGGSAGGSGTVQPDLDSNREATQQQVLTAVRALAPLLGSTDGLETLAATNRDLLTQMQALLQTLGGNTDDLERLLSALGVTDENVLSKLEALRVLTESTNAHMQAANGNSFVLASQAMNEGVHVRPAADVWAPAAPLSAAAGTSSAALPNPHGAKLRSATVHVVSGDLYRNVGADASSTCPRLEVGDSERLTAAQYAAYRVLRAGDTDAALHIEFEVQP